MYSNIDIRVGVLGYYTVSFKDCSLNIVKNV
ncbi:MAG: hypothetical protein ACI9QN_002733, partial [Arcticibacterium sp.]